MFSEAIPETCTNTSAPSKIYYIFHRRLESPENGIYEIEDGSKHEVGWEPLALGVFLERGCNSGPADTHMMETLSPPQLIKSSTPFLIVSQPVFPQMHQPCWSYCPTLHRDQCFQLLPVASVLIHLWSETHLQASLHEAILTPNRGLRHQHLEGLVGASVGGSLPQSAVPHSQTQCSASSGHSMRVKTQCLRAWAMPPFQPESETAPIHFWLPWENHSL